MKKPIIVVIIILAIMGMIIPTTSAGFTNYIFKEDFDGTTLDNSTWVNQSSPFPYEMKDGELIIKTYQDPENKYVISRKYDISNIDHIRMETKITLDIDEMQNTSSFSAFRVFYLFGKDEGHFGNQANSTNVRFSLYHGNQFGINIGCGSTSLVSKTYVSQMAQGIYGNETVFYIIGEYYRHRDENNNTDYWEAQITVENATHIPIIANLDRLTETDDTLSVIIQDYHYSTSPPVDGEVRIDYIYLGEYEAEEKAEHNLFPMVLTFAMIFMGIGAIGTLADTFGKYEELWFYMMLLGIALLGISFILLPEAILGIPAYLYSIPPFLLVIEELYSIRQHGLF